MRSVIKTLWETTRIILHLHQFWVHIDTKLNLPSWRTDHQGYAIDGMYWPRNIALRYRHSRGEDLHVFFDPDHDGTIKWPTTATEN